MSYRFNLNLVWFRSWPLTILNWIISSSPSHLVVALSQNANQIGQIWWNCREFLVYVIGLLVTFFLFSVEFDMDLSTDTSRIGSSGLWKSQAVLIDSAPCHLLVLGQHANRFHTCDESFLNHNVTCTFRTSFWCPVQFRPAFLDWYNIWDCLAHLAFWKSGEALIDSVVLQGETYNSGHKASHHTSRGWNAHDDNYT